MDLKFTKDERPTMENFNKRFGDIYNKEETLSPETKTLLGLGEYDTPDDAFAGIATKLWVKLAEYKTAGSYTWTPPDDMFVGDETTAEIGVYLVGGGGSGAVAGTASASTNYYNMASGGAAGYAANAVMTVEKGQTYNLVVGEGGAAVSITATNHASGVNGGTTSFDGLTVSGGEGGTGSRNAVTTYARAPGASGGQGSDGVIVYNGLLSGLVITPRELFGGAESKSVYINATNYGLVPGGMSQSPRFSQNAFDLTMVTLCAGGAAAAYAGNQGSLGCAAQIINAMPDGTKGGDGVASNSDGLSAPAATGNGNGGGAAVYVGKASSAVTVRSGAGSPGMVIIYKKGVA